MIVPNYLKHYHFLGRMLGKVSGDLSVQNLVKGCFRIFMVVKILESPWILKKSPGLESPRKLPEVLKSSWIVSGSNKNLLNFWLNLTNGKFSKSLNKSNRARLPKQGRFLDDLWLAFRILLIISSQLKWSFLPRVFDELPYLMFVVYTVS